MKRFSVAVAVVGLAAGGVAAATGSAATSGTVRVDAKLTATKRIDAAPKGSTRPATVRSPRATSST